MIANLPNTISLQQIADFDFGDPDAANDQLLRSEDMFCVCPTASLERFLEDKTSFLVGERGTGKTCIFELLRRNVLGFQSQTGWTNKIIHLDTKLDYSALRDQVLAGILSNFDDKTLNHRLVWELWLVAALINEFQGESLPSSLNQEIDYFKQFFSPELARKNIIRFFTEQKKQVGFKIDPSKMLGMFSWDFYAALSPADGTDEPNKSVNVLELSKIKNEIDAHLSNTHTRLHVLVDKLDEFVVGEDYNTQLLSLESLLSVERSYQQHENIKLKIFYRSDLFDQIDKCSYGADKVHFRTERITWGPKDIRSFIVRRIAYNYMRILNLKSLNVVMNKEKLYIDKHSNDLDRLEHYRQGRIWYRCSAWIRKSIPTAVSVMHAVGILKLRRMYDSGRYRHSTLNEELDMVIIRSFLGDEVYHHDGNGNMQPISLEDFLDTHFVLASGHPTPRVILMFLRYCISATRLHYNQNPDLAQQIEFPVIPKECVSQAYADLRGKMWELLADEAKDCRDLVLRFRTKVKEREFTYAYAKKALAVDSEEDMRRVLAVMQHLGIIRCTAKERQHNQRKYEYPIIFRHDKRK